jgi:hypothetical protein
MWLDYVLFCCAQMMELLRTWYDLRSSKLGAHSLKMVLDLCRLRLCGQRLRVWSLRHGRKFTAGPEGDNFLTCSPQFLGGFRYNIYIRQRTILCTIVLGQPDTKGTDIADLSTTLQDVFAE